MSASTSCGHPAALALVRVVPVADSCTAAKGCYSMTLSDAGTVMPHGTCVAVEEPSTASRAAVPNLWSPLMFIRTQPRKPSSSTCGNRPRDSRRNLELEAKDRVLSAKKANKLGTIAFGLIFCFVVSPASILPGILVN